MKMVAVIEKLKDLYPGTGKASGGRTGGQHDGTADHRAGGRYAGLWALYRKEMGDNIHSRRFLLILALVVLAGFASLYGALSNISSAASGGEFIFLKLFTTSGSSIPSFVSFIAILGPFVGLALGFDAINGERNSGTLNRLLSQPIYRDSVINGKFLAGAVTIFIMVLAMGGLVSAIGLLAIGIPPSLEEVGRILVFLLFTGVYICFWLGLSILFSVVCRHAATSALAVIACWLFFTIFMSLLAGIIAAALYPLDGYLALFNTVDNYKVTMYLNRISPYYLYAEAVTTILNPGVRSIGLVTTSQLEGAVAGYLPFGQSLLLVWPHLVAMLALTLAAFTISYLKFMNQEIRAN